ncbi:hypothetical protein [Sinomonas humi]|uniref:hypothetical protein n=1 Tax=Sinomonas humi TaxID=1338436 RepID=UPI00068EE531|nr:hypothetical protein [Sinomonas humi]
MHEPRLWPGWPVVLRWLLAPLVAGIVLGVVWWLAAPGGRLYGDGSNYQDWLPRDLVFAGLGALAAVVVVIFVVRAHVRFGFAARYLAVLVGSGLGSLLMWLTGTGLGRVIGSSRTDPKVDGSAFGLDTLSALALWPAIVAIVVLALVTVLWSPPTRR